MLLPEAKLCDFSLEVEVGVNTGDSVASVGTGDSAGVVIGVKVGLYEGGVKISGEFSTVDVLNCDRGIVAVGVDSFSRLCVGECKGVVVIRELFRDFLELCSDEGDAVLFNGVVDPFNGVVDSFNGVVDSCASARGIDLEDSLVEVGVGLNGKRALMLPSVLTGVSVKDILALRVEVLDVLVLGVLAVGELALEVVAGLEV